MKRYLLAAFVLNVAVSSAALAQAQRQDAKAGSWLGPYIGAAVAHTKVTKTTSNLEPSGWSGVGLIGANFYQNSSVVLGAEGAVGLFGSVKDGAASLGPAWSISVRAGLPVGDLMPYVSLGIGRGEGKYSEDNSTANFRSKVYGLGLEGRIDSRMNWRVEALQAPASGSKMLGGVSVKPDTRIFRAGLTYRFN